MFREMRRKRQQISNEECERVLRENVTGVLGVIGDGGYPYTVPVNYHYTDGKIYFHGAKSGHKIDSMLRNDKVSFCVIDRDDVDSEKMTTLYRSVIIFGRARVIDDTEEMIEKVREFGLRYNPSLDAVNAEIKAELPGLRVFEITPEHMTGKVGKELLHSTQ